MVKSLRIDTTLTTMDRSFRRFTHRTRLAQRRGARVHAKDGRRRRPFVVDIAPRAKPTAVDAEWPPCEMPWDVGALDGSGEANGHDGLLPTSRRVDLM